MKWKNYKKRIFKKIGKSLCKIGIFAGVISFVFCGMSILSGTSSYFNDIGISNSNDFSAGILDFNLSSGGDFSPTTINKDESTIRTIDLDQNGSLDFQYSVNVNSLSGDACDYLDLTANLDGIDVYTGPLKDFVYGPIIFSATETWVFTTILQAGTPDNIQGTTCNFDFIFDGVQIGGSGFYNQEIINNNITIKYWNPPVVLNEFLPNPIGDDDCSLTGINGEWVEIYNKTSNPLDLIGWYIKNAANDKIIIQSSNTLSGFTTIDAQESGSEWLVLFMNGCILNNAGDTVSLYNSNDILIDSYTYALPEYNINNTPGQTNNLTGYWPLDDDIEDISGNTNNGTNNGAIFVSSPINGGLGFDGTNDYVEINDSSSLNITNQITMEVWIKPSTTINSTNSNMRIIDKQNAYYLLFDYPGANGRLKLILRIGGSYIDLSSITNNWNAGQWYHIVGTYNGSVMSIYVNGVLENSKSKTGNIENTNYNLFFGARAVSNIVTNMFFDGVIDEIKIYDKALDFSEVISHYGQIPENKSYARIPDGSSNWVDPVPTPGKPNILEEQTEIITQENFEEFENINNISSNEFIISESIEVAEPTIIEEINEIVSGITENIEEILPEQILEQTIKEVAEEVEEVIETEPITEPIAEEAPTIKEQIITEEETAVEELSIQELIIESEPIIEPEPVIEELIIEEPILSE
jgi:hypothetical protein